MDVCSIYKDDIALTYCKFCGEPRFKPKRGRSVTYKDVPHKRIHYLPLIPRLKRLNALMSLAPYMRWHFENRMSNGVMIHPSQFIFRCMVSSILTCTIWLGVWKSELQVGQCIMSIVISFIQLNEEGERKLTTLGFVLREIYEKEKVIGMEWLMKYLNWSTLVNLLKWLCYLLVNGIIQHVPGEHVNTMTTK